jgi:hypothetical protein
LFAGIDRWQASGAGTGDGWHFCGRLSCGELGARSSAAVPTGVQPGGADNADNGRAATPQTTGLPAKDSRSASQTVALPSRCAHA